MKCPKCKTENPDSASFCVNCGHDLLKEEEQQGSPKGKTGNFFSELIPQKWLRWTILIALLLIVTVIILTATNILPTNLFGNKKYLLIGVPQNDEEVDVYLVKPDQTLREVSPLFENTIPSPYIFEKFNVSAQYNIIGLGDFAYGGFVKDRNEVFYQYMDDDEDYFLEKFTIGDDNPRELYKGNNPLYTLVPEQGKSFFLIELDDGDNDTELYFAQDGENLHRIDKAIYSLGFSDDETTLITAEDEYDEDGWEVLESRFSIYQSPDFLEEIEINTDAEAIYYGHSGSGNILYYMVSDPDDGTLTLFIHDIENDEELFEIKADYGMDAFTSQAGDAIGYAVENEEGLVELFFLEDGEWVKVDEGLSIYATFNHDGSQIAYMIEEDDTDTLYLYNTKNNEKIEILAEDGLSFNFIEDLGYLLIYDEEDDEMVIHLYNIASDTLTEIINLGYSPSSISPLLVNNTKTLIFTIYDPEKEKYEIFVQPLGNEDGFFFRDEWDTFVMLDISNAGASLVFYGREDYDDDYALYLTSLTERSTPYEIDDDGEYGYGNAIFSSNDKELFFTAVTGSDEDDVEIKKTSIKGEEFTTETLYRDAYLMDAQWYDRYKTTYITQYDYLYVEGMSFCPNKTTVAVGEEVDISLDAEDSICFVVDLEEDQVTSITAAGDTEIDMTLYDRNGNIISNDYGSYTTWIMYQPETSGKYFVYIESYYYEDLDFTFQVNEGTGYSMFDSAPEITAGENIRGYILSGDAVDDLDYFGIYYADIYYFEAEAGDRISIDVIADSIGSYLDPHVYLLGPMLNYIQEDDDSGDDYDSQIIETLDEDGRYYIIVTRHGGSFGYSQDYFYDLVLQLY